ncbi:Uncharacterized protein dnm_087850 [Desulfonema magnum]|uniref:Uncharacterized protein n=1 Tax=Desulfonema magnum TaxID=45655 RepID=A0A975GT73_9BACT|nr:Uncharacterized protein dnm_087850 [Desulfonema magnum]
MPNYLNSRMINLISCQTLLKRLNIELEKRINCRYQVNIPE